MPKKTYSDLEGCPYEEYIYRLQDAYPDVYDEMCPMPWFGGTDEVQKRHLVHVLCEVLNLNPKE